MKLNRLIVFGLKGQDFELNLSDLNMLVGRNWTGKTARTDAIRLLLLGYLPEQGKTPRATFGLCSGRQMSVEGWFDSGERIFRRWFLEGDSVRTEQQIPLTLEESGTLFSVMLNAETYLSLTERARVNYLFGNLPDLGPDNTLERLEARFLQEINGTEGLKSRALVEFGIRYRAAREKLSDDSNDEISPQVFLEWEVEWVAEEAKRTKAHVGVMEKTVQGLAYLRTQDAAADDKLPGIEKEMSEHNQELEVLRGRKATKVAELEAARVLRNRRAALISATQERPRLLAQKETLTTKVDTLRKALEAIEVLEPAALEQVRISERESFIAVNNLQRDLKAIIESIQKNKRDVLELHGKDKCSYCGSSGDGWKAIKQAEIASALAGLDVKREQLTTHLERVTNHAQQEHKRMREANTAAGLRRGKESDLNSALEALRAVERSLSITDQKAAELAGLVAENQGQQLEVEVNRLQDEITRRLSLVSALELRRRAIVGRAHDMKRLAEAETSRDQEKEVEEVVKAAGGIVRAQQAEIVAAAFHPFLAAANEFTTGILRSALAYNESTAEIGTWRAGTWVSHKTFSGAERRLTYVAIQAALASRSPFRIMLLDEMGTIDDVAALEVFRTIMKALEGKLLDQFIGIDTGRGLLYSAEADFGGKRLTLEAIS